MMSKLNATEYYAYDFVGWKENFLNKLKLDEHIEKVYDEIFMLGYNTCALEIAKGKTFYDGFKEGFEKGINLCNEYQRSIDENDVCYDRGLNDAWKCAKKLFSDMSDDDIEQIFPDEWHNDGFRALIKLPPSLAIEKIKEFENKKARKEMEKILNGNQ